MDRDEKGGGGTPYGKGMKRVPIDISGILRSKLTNDCHSLPEKEAPKAYQ